MMIERILITIWGRDVAPRFDLTTEVLIASVGQEGRIVNRRTMVLPSVSAEDLCHLILTEGISLVICGGIEEEYYQYLIWKKIRVIDSVIGPFEQALERYLKEELEPGSNFMNEPSQDNL